jgi:hypothetical protein
MKKARKSEIIKYYLCNDVKITTLNKMIENINVLNFSLNKIIRLNNILYNNKYND